MLKQLINLDIAVKMFQHLDEINIKSQNKSTKNNCPFKISKKTPNFF